MSHIKALIATGDWRGLRERSSVDVAPEIAEHLVELPEHRRIAVFRALSRDTATRVFVDIPADVQYALLHALTDEETRDLLARSSPDDLARLIGAAPVQVGQTLIGLLSPEDLREVRLILGYPEESVGRLITPDYVAIRPEWTIGRAGADSCGRKGQRDHQSDLCDRLRGPAHRRHRTAQADPGGTIDDDRSGDGSLVCERVAKARPDLAALPQHHHLFRSVSDHPSLMDEAIDVHPEALSLDVLRERAWQVVLPHDLQRLAGFVEAFGAAAANGRGADDLPGIAEAAVVGRVATILLEADRLFPGRGDAGTGGITADDPGHPEVDDVLDDLGEIVLREGGEAIVVPADRMPTDTGAAAICRF